MQKKLMMTMGMVSLTALLTSAAFAGKPTGGGGGSGSGSACSPDSVKVGDVCIDKYEASVWEVPAGNSALIAKIKQGTVTLTDLLSSGAIQRGVNFTSDYPCSKDGNTCKDAMYAVSIPGAPPSVMATWFQAQQACGNADKRLPRNAEWQMAAAGTPDPGTDNGSTDCNITNDGPYNDPVNTGSRANCVSNWGVFDMVGNVEEWVEDWTQLATACVPKLFPETGDHNCLAGASTTEGPGALSRGGGVGSSNISNLGAGVFSITTSSLVSTFSGRGFRCAR